jgi:hypothetical protein
MIAAKNSGDEHKRSLAAVLIPALVLIGLLVAVTLLFIVPGPEKDAAAAASANCRFVAKFFRCLNRGELGQLGDFVGGVFNPLVSIITLGVAYQVYDFSRKEALATKAAFAEQLRAMEVQSEIMKTSATEQLAASRLQNEAAIRSMRLQLFGEYFKIYVGVVDQMGGKTEGMSKLAQKLYSFTEENQVGKLSNNIMIPGDSYVSCIELLVSQFQKDDEKPLLDIFAAQLNNSELEVLGFTICRLSHRTPLSDFFHDRGLVKAIRNRTVNIYEEISLLQTELQKKLYELYLPPP